ncbi:MAG: hypothetical protein WA110_05260 [Anaerolineaceae bacterium]
MKSVRFLLSINLLLGTIISQVTLPMSKQVSAAQAQNFGIENRNVGEYIIPATHCFVLLEPVFPNQTSSEVLDISCGLTSTKLQSMLAANTAYLVAQFYDNQDYDGLIVNFAGTQRCSSTVSYQVAKLESSLDNRISSGAGYSGCNNTYVYDLENFSGSSTSCYANCSSFGSLNDRVSSWKVTN